VSLRQRAAVVVALVLAAPPVQAQHLNPLVDLLAAKQPLFGLYAPANPRGRGGRGGPPGAPGAAPAPAPAPAPAMKTPAELAKDAITRAPNDYIFDGSMEGDFDRGYTSFAEFVKGYADAGSPAERWKHPLVVKTHEIAENPTLAAERIGKQLDLGVSTIVFVGVESPDEVKTGLAAMRFKANGGTRPDAVGGAAAFWGLSEKDYKAKADLWPLNPKGELLNWTIVESKPGLARVREIAAVKGIGVLFPGAGTLRGVFSTQDSTGRRVTDEKAWEDAIQQVLAACKEFNVPCGFPANTPDVMEMRYKQGFRVFVIGWGDNGFKTVEAGLALSGRTK
jgi:4-hydroxy-2-oxoheptanedioate aldolase